MRRLSALLIGASFAMMVSLFLSAAHAQAASSTGALAAGDLGNKYLAAGIAFGLAAAGAGYGVAQAGSAAIAAVVEKPEVRTAALIFVALAEAIAIYGFVIAIIILGQPTP